MKNWNTKLTKAVNGDEELEKKIETLLECFSKQSEKEAKTFLISIITDTDTLSRKLGIDSSILRTSKSTLVSYYKETNPKSWLTQPQELPASMNKITDDVTLGELVYQVISQKNSSATKEEAERTLFLLQSNEEKLFYGGLRDLGFSKELSEYFKSKVNEIAILFKEELDIKSSYISKSPSTFTKKIKGDKKTTPVIQEIVPATDNVVPEKTSAENIPTEKPSTGNIVPETENRLKKSSLFPNRTALLSFYNLANKLLKQGIDPCIALQNQEKILTLISDEFI